MDVGAPDRSCFVASMRTTAAIASISFVSGLMAWACTGEQLPAEEGSSVAPSSQPAPAPASAPASRPGSGPAAAAGPHGEPVAGLIKLADGIDASTIKPTDVLFVMARSSHGVDDQGRIAAGRLVAVQRYGQVSFPKRYELTAEDAMVPNVPFQGPFVVYARLDKDGDPMTRGEDDLYGAVGGEVQSGNLNVEIVLNKKAVNLQSQPVTAPAH